MRTSDRVIPRIRGAKRRRQAQRIKKRNQSPKCREQSGRAKGRAAGEREVQPLGETELPGRARPGDRGGCAGGVSPASRTDELRRRVALRQPTDCCVSYTQREEEQKKQKVGTGTRRGTTARGHGEARAGGAASRPFRLPTARDQRRSCTGRLVRAAPASCRTAHACPSTRTRHGVPSPWASPPR